jgi:hypothetical protein
VFTKIKLWIDAHNGSIIGLEGGQMTLNSLPKPHTKIKPPMAGDMTGELIDFAVGHFWAFQDNFFDNEPTPFMSAYALAVGDQGCPSHPRGSFAFSAHSLSQPPCSGSGVDVAALADVPKG